MRVLPFAVLGAVAYVAFVVAGIPASFVLAQAQRALPGKIEVRAAHGSAWRGSAQLTIATPGGPVALDRLEWRWLPSRLVAGRFAFAVGAASQGIEANFEAARTVGSWETRDLAAHGPAAALTALLPWLAPWRPEGAMRIASPHLATDGSEVRGEARVEWSGASVALSEVKPLGSYRADIVAEGHAGRLTVTTLEGPLQVAGKGTLNPPARLAFSGEARATGAQEKALEPLLNLLGPARIDGARTLDWRLP